MKRALLFSISLLLLAAVACDQVELTAPDGATLTITAQPLAIGERGSSTITVSGTRQNGAPLPDGTTIHFTTTDLGTITPNPVEIQNGIAVATFRALGKSGVAEVTATSGVDSTDSIEITIGDSRIGSAVMFAPGSLSNEGGTVPLRVLVRDEAGNPLQGVSVIFAASEGRLQSNGSVVVTDSTGNARDVLIVDDPSGNPIQVSALVGNEVVEATIDVVANEPPTCAFIASPSSVEVGQNVSFTDISTDNDGVIADSFYDFGDGDTSNGRSVNHDYDDPGTYTITHIVTDDDGLSDTCTQTVTVEEEQPGTLSCTFTTSPDSPSTGDQVVFNASTSSSSAGEIVEYTWNFGDSAQVRRENDPITTHTYTDPGLYNVVLTIEDEEGDTASCFESVTVN